MESPNSNMNRLFQTAGQKQTQQGTGYTNLNRVFQANQGNKLGQKVVGDISTQLSGAKSALQQEQDKFKEQSEANRLDTDENKNQRATVLGRFSSASSAGGDVADEDVNKFQQFRSGDYKGPSGLSDTSGIQQTASGIAQQTSNFTPSGTKELLRRSVGGNRYTQGQTKLDSLLMDRSALTPISRQAQGLTQEINRANLGAQGQAQAFSSQAKQFGQETQDQINQGLTGLDTAAQEKLTAAQTVEKDRLARIEAVQNFAANKVVKRDTSGNILKDQYGNTLYDDTIKARGDASNQYQELDNLANLLKSQGADANELNQLLGSGGFGDIANRYNQQAAGVQGIKDSFWGSANYTSGANGGLVDNKTQLLRNAGVSEAVIQQLRGQNMAYDEGSPTLDENGVPVINWSGGAGGGSAQGLALLQNRINEISGAKNTEIANVGGIAGQASAAGKTEDFYKNLAKSLANSQSAQGLTLQGTAGAPIRSNYSALQKLMGQGADLQKFKDTDEQYQAGNFLLNPDLIKRSL